jgi:hypothetical protein
MENIHVEFSFKGKARWRQWWNFLTTGKVYTFLTERDILTLYQQYLNQKRV